MMDVINANTEQNSFDLKTVVSKLLPQWYWFAISLVVCLCFAYYKNLHIIPQYSCNATMILKTSNPQKLVGLNALAPTTDIENEIGQLKSNTLARMTLNKLDFGTNYYREGHYSADKELVLWRSYPRRTGSAAEDQNDPIYDRGGQQRNCQNRTGHTHQTR